MSGYDSAGGASSTFGGPSTSTAAGTSNNGGGGGGTKRRRVNADPDFYPGAAPTTKRAQANWKAAQEQAQIRNAQAMQQQQHDAQLANAAAGGAGLSQQQAGRMHLQADAQQPRQPILSLATLPPEALQRYLSRYGLIDPAGLLSFHHAVFPVPPLPETLHPPLEGRQLNVRKAKMTYVPAARNAKILAARAAAGLPAPGTADEPASGGESARADVQGGVEAKGAADAAADDATTAGTNATGGPAATGNRADDTTAGNPSGAPSAVQRPAVSTSTTSRPWLEPKTPEFAGLSAFDNPDVVLSRLAARATQHWDKRESLKEAETLTNFMFSVRNRGRTLRATPAG